MYVAPVPSWTHSVNRAVTCCFRTLTPRPSWNKTLHITWANIPVAYFVNATNTSYSILRVVYSIYTTRTKLIPSCNSLPFQRPIFCSTDEWAHKGGETRSRYAQSVFLRDGNGRAIFSTGQHAVEALISSATCVWGGERGRVPVTPVSMGALVQQRLTTKQPQLEKCIFRENVKMCAREQF